MRGNGDSDGLMADEYTKQEQDDALEVIAWIARQKWCTGKVGMFGISWGGFNALQVAARKPAGAEGHRHHLLDRRPLRGRRPLQGRHGDQRDAGLGRHHAGLFLAPAGSQDRRQQVAQDVDGAAEERALPDHSLALAPASRRLLEAWLGVRGLRSDRGADPLRGRLERRLFECHSAPDEGPAHHAQGDHRSLGAQVSAFRRAGAAHRLPAGNAALVGPVAEERGDRGQPRSRLPRTM